jgi:hypothetical protein
MKYLVLFISLLIGQAFAADTVRLQDATTFVTTGVTSTSFSLYTDSPSGDATADTAPARVYLPLTNTGMAIADHDKYFALGAGALRLFDVSNTSGDLVYVPLTISTPNTMYLYVAAKLSTGTGYKIIQQYSTNSVTGNIDISDFGLLPKKICDQYASDCASVLPAATASSKVTFMLYYFLSPTSGLPLGDTVDPTATTGGIFVEMPMSNRVYQATELKTYITATKKGDGRAVLTYTGDASILDFKKVIVFKHTSAPATDNLPIGDYTGSIVSTDFPAVQSSDITVSGLQNQTPYIFSVAFQDKFGFATTLSADVSVTPIQIEELLKKQACYILTAGFGEEHYITNYFRSYRDHVLAHSWLGRKFIHLYYGTAPHYALIIYKSEKLRFMVRMFAYGLYFIFNYGWIVLIFFGSCFFLNFLRKNKILLQNNRL